MKLPVNLGAITTDKRKKYILAHLKLNLNLFQVCGKINWIANFGVCVESGR
jgi:hypothetical protein